MNTRSLTLLIAGAAVAVAGIAHNSAQAREVPPALRFTMKDIDGKPVELSSYQGKVVMFVNVASRCGLTPQYTELQALYEKYKDRGFVILGFPANEFGAQEPGTNAEIKQFCTSKYNVTFPMFSKVVVKGEGISPFYKHLTTESPFKGEIEWNFAKFLVGRNGEVIGRFKPQVKPTDPELAAEIERALAAK